MVNCSTVTYNRTIAIFYKCVPNVYLTFMRFFFFFCIYI